VLVVPVGTIRRLFGKEGMPLGFDPSAPSYWQPREDGNVSPESFRNQF